MIPYILLLWALYLLIPAGAGLRKDMQFAEHVVRSNKSFEDIDWPKEFDRNSLRVFVGLVLNSAAFVLLDDTNTFVFNVVLILAGFLLTVVEVTVISALAHRK